MKPRFTQAQIDAMRRRQAELVRLTTADYPEDEALKNHHAEQLRQLDNLLDECSARDEE